MPQKSIRFEVKGQFGSKWRKQVERIAAKRSAAISKVMAEQIETIIDRLQATAPLTSGQLLGTPGVPVKYKQFIPKSKQGFRKFRKEQKGKRTFTILNAAWPVYGKKLESGEIVHNSALGGRSWNAGFLQAAKQLARQQARAELRRKG